MTMVTAGTIEHWAREKPRCRGHHRRRSVLDLRRLERGGGRVAAAWIDLAVRRGDIVVLRTQSGRLGYSFVRPCKLGCSLLALNWR